MLGEMGRHTANAGRIYFPSGTPDLDDISDGMVDIAGSVVREVEEETGLTPAEYRAGAHWDCVDTGASIAMIRILQVDMPGEALRAQDRGQSRPADLARTFRNPSGAQATATSPRRCRALSRLFWKRNCRRNPALQAWPVVKFACAGSTQRNALDIFGTPPVIGANNNKNAMHNFQGGFDAGA